MLLQAAQDFNIYLNQSWKIRDSKHDIVDGRTAGCRTALVGADLMGQDITVNGVLDFVHATL